jgi:4-diphosphocytidyl-2-C-methyl-D-erythritol kinase
MKTLPNTIRLPARAKVNLFLRVLGPRGDGYHDLETLVVPISLADTVEVHAFSDPSRFRTLSLSLDVAGDPRLVRGVPADETNVAIRAAMALADRIRPFGFAEIRLEKVVPSAAGLGGGSADAAATLEALDRLWGSGLSVEELRDVGAAVGSDVPALMAGGPVVARGRGERVEPIALPALEWRLITFPFGVSTADAFRWWDDDGAATGPDPGPVLEAARSGDHGRLGPLLYNDLEEPVMRRHPAVREAKERLVAAGAAGAIMCGSGPSVAGLVPGGAALQINGGLPVTSVGGPEG